MDATTTNTTTTIAIKNLSSSRIQRGGNVKPENDIASSATKASVLFG